MKNSGEICMHCGGAVGDDGYAMGGMIDEPLAEEEELSTFEGNQTEQHNAAMKMLDESGFGEAVRRRAHSYSSGGTMKAPKDDQELDVDKAMDDVSGPSDLQQRAMDEVRRRKMEKYGIRRAR